MSIDQVNATIILVFVGIFVGIYIWGYGVKEFWKNLF